MVETSVLRCYCQTPFLEREETALSFDSFDDFIKRLHCENCSVCGTLKLPGTNSTWNVMLTDDSFTEREAICKGSRLVPEGPAFLTFLKLSYIINKLARNKDTPKTSTGELCVL